MPRLPDAQLFPLLAESRPVDVPVDVPVDAPSKWHCSCRCKTAASSLCTFGIAAFVVAAVAAVHLLATHPLVVRPPPPAPCGTWPDFRPCGACFYGASRPPHRVRPKDTCDSIAREFGVPQFDLFNRNRSVSCCQQPNISATEWIDFCNPPSLEQWRRQGHPRQLPSDGKMVFSYVGATTVDAGGRGVGLRELPASINVAALGGIEDYTNSNGEFSIGVSRKFKGKQRGSLADNCTAQIDPQRAYRGMQSGRAGSADADATRVWLGSLIPIEPDWINQLNWMGGDMIPKPAHPLPPEEWAANATASLEKIILRYRLDGLDFNIEKRRTSFGRYLCTLVRRLQERLGPGLVISLTPCCELDQMYGQVATLCHENISLIQPQTYNPTPLSSKSLKASASNFGWAKTGWSLNTGPNHKRPSPAEAWGVVQQLRQQHPQHRGLFTWTAESSLSCSPPFCFENTLHAAQRSDTANPPPSVNKCQCR